MTFVATNSRKLAALLCALCLAAFLLPAAAHAEETALPESEKDTCTFTQQLVSSAPVLRVGEPLTVNLVLTCQNFDEYLMYSYSCTFRVDANLFDVVEYSAPHLMNRFNIAKYDDTLGNAAWHRFVVNGMAGLAGTSWQNHTVTATVTLVPKAQGATMAEITRTNISDETGMHRRPCVDSNLPLEISDQAPLPAALEGQPLTEASGLQPVVYAGEVPQGSVPTYQGNPFAWNGQHYVMLMTAAEFAYANSADFALEQGTAPAIALGDPSENGQINIVDAQIAYDAARGKYRDCSTLSACGWLSCDMNNDGVIDAPDALAIQVAALTAA